MRMCLVLAVLVAAACSSPLGVSEDSLPLLRSDATEYRLEVTGEWIVLTVPYEFTNQTDITLYAGGCRSALYPVFDRLEAGVWSLALSTPRLDCGANPIAIPPGTVVGDTASHTWRLSDDPDVSEPFVPGAVEGVYRIRWLDAAIVPFAGAGPTPGQELPVALSVSNSFRIIEP